MIYRLFTANELLGVFTEVEEAFDHAMWVVKQLTEDDDVVKSIAGVHRVNGGPLMEWRVMREGEPLLCVLYGATFAQWERYATHLRELKPN